jgi:predicted transcriptional regulator YdeE
VNSIGAHLTVAAVAVSRWIEQARTARYRTIKIQAHTYTITTADPLPRDLRDALDRIHGHLTAHQFGPTQVAAELIAASARVACAPSPAPDTERRA